MAWRWIATILCFTLYLGGCANVPTDKDRQALADGFDQYAAHRFVAAQTTADDYVKKFPEDRQIDEAYYLRGLCRMGRSDKTGATADLRQAITKTQRIDLKAQSYRALGDMAFDAKLFDQAVTNYRESLAQYQIASKMEKSNAPVITGESRVVFRLGASMQGIGQWEAARPYLQQVAQSSNDPALKQLAQSRLLASSFYLQFGVFTELLRAQGKLAQLKSQGINALITNEMRDGKLIFVLRMGAYPTYAQAQMALNQVKDKQRQTLILP